MRPRRGVAGVRSEEADRRVPPVVRQSPRLQDVLVGDVVDREKLDGRDAEIDEVRDRRLGREPGVGAAKILADARQEAREALHVELVDHRLVPRAAQELIALPLERLVDHDRLRDRRCVVARVDHEVVAVRVGERAPAIPEHRPFDRLCVGVDQELVRIEPVAPLRRPRPVDAVAVELPRPDTVEVAVPVVGGLPRQLTSCLDAGGVEEAQLDALGVLRAQREVRAAAVPARAERERLSGPGAHRLTLTPATGGAPRSAYPAASAARSPRSAQTEKTTASRSASPKLSPTWAGSPARRPRPAPRA